MTPGQNLIGFGLVLIVFGVVYLTKPNLFRRWWWKRTNIMQNLLSPAAYEKYMKGLGVFYLIVGAVLCFYGYTHFARHD